MQEHDFRIENIIRAFLYHQEELRDKTIVVAVSGGADSVCLLHVLNSLKNEFNIKLKVAHLNHGLRGNKAKDDANYVIKLAESLELPVTARTEDAEKHRLVNRLSLEEAARELRYRFLQEVAESSKATNIAIGHTKDDLIETVVMHMIRGTGARGLLGIREITRLNTLKILRPMLEISRFETNDYCSKHDLNPRQDETNLSLTQFRNRIRLELIPELKKYNPGFDKGILRLAKIIVDDLDYIDNEVQRIKPNVVSIERENVLIDKKQFRNLHPSLQRNLLRDCIEELQGHLKDIEAVHIDDILMCLDKPTGKNIDLPGGLKFIVCYNDYLLSKESQDSPISSDIKGEYPLKKYGRTIIPGWVITTEILAKPLAGISDRYTAFLDSDKLGRQLTVRTHRRGDRFRPLGLGFEKKLSHFMIDAKIPRFERSKIPLVIADDQIAWLVGHRIDERFRITEESSRVIQITFEGSEVRTPF
jgi:tRNA(Ile)-lysidine synthase